MDTLSEEMSFKNNVAVAKIRSYEPSYVGIVYAIISVAYAIIIAGKSIAKAILIK